MNGHGADMAMEVFSAGSVDLDPARDVRRRCHAAVLVTARLE
jgi:hypothetical protein